MEETWDLERVFPGGRTSKAFRQFLGRLQRELQELEYACQTLLEDQVLEVDQLKKRILESQDLYKKWYQAFEFVMCLKAQDTTDQQAQILLDEIHTLSSSYSRCHSALDAAMLQLPEASWHELLHFPETKPFSFILEERRRLRQTMKSQDVEEAFQTVEADGLHAWGDFYPTIVGRMTIEGEDCADREGIPVIQAAKTVYYGEDRGKRIALFRKWKEAWEEEAELCAKAINHIAGFRLNVYRHRGWDSFLHETLAQNRIKEHTVRMMWDVIFNHRKPLLNYLHRKRELFGADELCWTDQFAPLPLEQKGSRTLSFGEAASFIERHLRSFDEHLADFAGRVFREQWIDAAPDPKKAAGAFCAPFPLSHESRIMMTFHHDLSSTGVLAHEVGHAYHYHLLQEQPMFLQDCPPTVAEMASTLTETIVMKAAVADADNDVIRLHLINNQLIRDVGILLNGHVRYIFETNFYERRKVHVLSVDELNQLMVAAQKEAFAGQLATYEPTFWASLRHFYMTRHPFIHYPYTVAHLISTGFYAILEHEANQGERLRQLLAASTQMTVEELGQKYLGVDLEKPEFWIHALDKLSENVEAFLALTEKIHYLDT